MKEPFAHRALELTGVKQRIIFTALSKKYFFMREHISRHVLEDGGVPLNPFMTFNYFLGDTVNRDVIRKANNRLLALADELWVYGSISDGVLAEVIQSHKQHKPIRFFGVVNSKDFVEQTPENVEMENEVADQREMLYPQE